MLKCLNSSPWASRMIASASGSVSTAIRCSYHPMASASSVSDAHRRANVRVAGGSSSGGSWYWSKPIGVSLEEVVTDGTLRKARAAYSHPARAGASAGQLCGWRLVG